MNQGRLSSRSSKRSGNRTSVWLLILIAALNFAFQIAQKWRVRSGQSDPSRKNGRSAERKPLGPVIFGGTALALLGLSYAMFRYAEPTPPTLTDLQRGELVVFHAPEVRVRLAIGVDAGLGIRVTVVASWPQADVAPNILLGVGADRPPKLVLFGGPFYGACDPDCTGPEGTAWQVLSFKPTPASDFNYFSVYRVVPRPADGRDLALPGELQGVDIDEDLRGEEERSYGAVQLNFGNELAPLSRRGSIIKAGVPLVLGPRGALRNVRFLGECISPACEATAVSLEQLETLRRLGVGITDLDRIDTSRAVLAGPELVIAELEIPFEHTTIALSRANPTPVSADLPLRWAPATPGLFDATAELVDTGRRQWERAALFGSGVVAGASASAAVAALQAARLSSRSRRWR